LLEREYHISPHAVQAKAVPLFAVGNELRKQSSSGRIVARAPGGWTKSYRIDTVKSVLAPSGLAALAMLPSTSLLPKSFSRKVGSAVVGAGVGVSSSSNYGSGSRIPRLPRHPCGGERNSDRGGILADALEIAYPHIRRAVPRTPSVPRSMIESEIDRLFPLIRVARIDARIQGLFTEPALHEKLERSVRLFPLDHS
jgi:hypothetical protein